MDTHFNILKNIYNTDQYQNGIELYTVSNEAGKAIAIHNLSIANTTENLILYVHLRVNKASTPGAKIPLLVGHPIRSRETYTLNRNFNLQVGDTLSISLTISPNKDTRIQVPSSGYADPDEVLNDLSPGQPGSSYDDSIYSGSPTMEVSGVVTQLCSVVGSALVHFDNVFEKYRRVFANCFKTTDKTPYLIVPNTVSHFLVNGIHMCNYSFLNEGFINLMIDTPEQETFYLARNLELPPRKTFYINKTIALTTGQTLSFQTSNSIGGVSTVISYIQVDKIVYDFT